MALNQPTACAPSASGAVATAVVRGFDLAWLALAATLIPVSLIWDFSWESTIGVDRFWSPPHVATHLGVWLSGLLGVRLVCKFTVARPSRISSTSIKVFGAHGPAGAWVLLWGAGIMLVAFLLDAWWQQAYGLGAGIWSPPQILKTVGFFVLLTGGLLIGCRARDENVIGKKTAAAFLVWQGGLLLAMVAVVLATRNYPNWQHGAMFHLISCAVYPAMLFAVGRLVAERWGATSVALAYMIVWSGLVWGLPLFPAHPLTAPIHNPMDHMMPPPFPLLLVGPAVLVDVLRARMGAQGMRKQEFIRAGILGWGFVTVFVPTQWFFAEFLLSQTADNWFFAGGGRNWPFFLKIDQARTLFWDAKTNPFTWKSALLAGGFAWASMWGGLRAGEWLSKVRR